MPDAVLGIDTSCYTTSVALACDGKVICSRRRLLNVPAGERGLRQSEAVFQHIKALPELLELLFSEAKDIKLTAVSVSSRPRDCEDSYMPVFQAGTSVARSIAAAYGLPVFCTSHQHGHVRAALVDSGLSSDRFIALHLSGGTTQSLLVEGGRITEIGGTNDLNAGQLVDRVGVHMGFGFPAGAQLEKLAVNGKAKALIPLSRNQTECSVSGAQNKAFVLLEEGLPKEDVAREVYSFLERCVCHLISSACEKANAEDVLLAGGVASSLLLRKLVTQRIAKHHNHIKLHWAKPELSGDNACGVALIGDDLLRRKANGSVN